MIRFEMTPKIKKQLNKIAFYFGVQLNWDRSPKESFQFDGVDIACKDQCPSNIIHDIAHWIICPEKRRSKKDFGLGQGPDSLKKSSAIVSDRASLDEEERASALGIWFEKKMEWDWESTKLYHAWGSHRLRSPSLEDYWIELNCSQYEALF